MYDDGGTEAEALAEWEDYWDDKEDYDGEYEYVDFHWSYPSVSPSPQMSAERAQRESDRERQKNKDRYRCCVTGCNPVLYGHDNAMKHVADTGHRIAKWPIRSADGHKKAQRRNRTGYYDKYNVGTKSERARGIR